MVIGPKWWRCYTIAFLILIGCIYWLHGQLRLADPDEFQFLVNAFDAARGLTPYVDFWDNHGPLNIWLVHPLAELWSGRHDFILWLRQAMAVITLAVGIIVLIVSRRTYRRFSAAPWIALVFLLSSPPFVAKAIEIRGDNPANLLFAIALTLLISAMAGARKWRYFAAGLCIGLIAGFTLKVVVHAAALFLFCACWLLKEKRLPRPGDLFAVATGAGIPIVVMITSLAVQGSFEGFVACYFGGNVNRDFQGFTSTEFLDIYKKAPFWSLIATGVLFHAVWRLIRNRADAVESGLCVMVLFLLAQYLLLLPTKNMQSLLPVYVPLALLAGRSIGEWLQRHRHDNWHRRPALAIPIMIILPLLIIRDMDDYSDLTNVELPKQISFSNKVLNLTENEPYIFDPSGVVFLKPRPGQFHVLVTFVREMHQSRSIDLEIPAMLEAKNINTVVFDNRAKDLRVSDVQYLIENFEPVLKGRDCWLLRRKSAVSISESDMPSIQLLGWPDEIYEDAKIPPASPTDAPEWYQKFTGQ